MDLSPFTDDDLRSLRVQVQAELDRRALVASAGDRISQINTEVLTASGVSDGDDWTQPTDASNAYPEGWTVTYNGQKWISLIPANTTKPGDPSDPQNYRWWKNAAPPAPPGPPAIPAWDPAGHAYKIADVVTYQSKTYRCIQAHTSQPGWDPASVPALWTVTP